MTYSMSDVGETLRGTPHKGWEVLRTGIDQWVGTIVDYRWEGRDKGMSILLCRDGHPDSWAPAHECHHILHQVIPQDLGKVGIYAEQWHYLPKPVLITRQAYFIADRNGQAGVWDGSKMIIVRDGLLDLALHWDDDPSCGTCKPLLVAGMLPTTISMPPADRSSPYPDAPKLCDYITQLEQERRNISRGK